MWWEKWRKDFENNERAKEVFSRKEDLEGFKETKRIFSKI